MTHLKFFDAWYKTFVLFICDLYWFNPLFLLMKRMAYRDVEYVCDEYVTKKMNALDKKIYGAVILKTVTEKYPRPVPSVVQLSCSQKELKRRLNNLFEFRNWGHGSFPLLISIVLIAILVMGISFTVKEVPMQPGKVSDSVPTDIKISKVTEDESMSGPYYTDDLEALLIALQQKKMWLIIPHILYLFLWKRSARKSHSIKNNIVKECNCLKGIE